MSIGYNIKVKLTRSNSGLDIRVKRVCLQNFWLEQVGKVKVVTEEKLKNKLCVSNFCHLLACLDWGKKSDTLF